MKTFVALAALMCLASGARIPRDYQTGASSSTRSAASARAKPIAILRSNLNSPGTPGYEKTFDYSFESENGIKQEAQGQMKTVGESEVMVMRGSYEYIDENGETVRVDWYADDTGYHPQSTIIPKPVEIPFPEIREAVEAQLRFAAQEKSSSDASTSHSYKTPEPEPVVVSAVRSPVPAPAPAPAPEPVAAPVAAPVAPAAATLRNTYLAAEPVQHYYFSAAQAPSAPVVAVRAHPQYVTYQGTY